MGVGLLDEYRRVAVGKLCLYEAVFYLLFLGSLDEALELGDTRFPAFLLDGELFQLVITGEVGEDGVVNHKLAYHLRVLLEAHSDGAVSPVDDAEQRLIVLLKESLVLGFEIAERLEDVGGDNSCVAATHPYMWVDIAAGCLGR